MSKKKILVIDDEESLCRSLKLNLEETEEYEVEYQTEGKKAFQKAFSYKPDLIILDVMLGPEMDGGAVENQLKQDPSTQNTPIIFLTAIATKEDTDDSATMIGGRYIIAKPVSTDELIQHIKIRLAGMAD